MSLTITLTDAQSLKVIGTSICLPLPGTTATAGGTRLAALGHGHLQNPYHVILPPGIFDAGIFRRNRVSDVVLFFTYSREARLIDRNQGAPFACLSIGSASRIQLTVNKSDDSIKPAHHGSSDYLLSQPISVAFPPEVPLHIYINYRNRPFIDVKLVAKKSYERDNDISDDPAVSAFVEFLTDNWLGHTGISQGGQGPHLWQQAAIIALKVAVGNRGSLTPSEVLQRVCDEMDTDRQNVLGYFGTCLNKLCESFRVLYAENPKRALILFNTARFSSDEIDWEKHIIREKRPARSPKPLVKIAWATAFHPSLLDELWQK